MVSRANSKNRRNDLIKDLFSIRAANLDPRVFDQKRHERFAVATATSQEPVNFIKKTIGFVDRDCVNKKTYMRRGFSLPD